MKEMSKLILFSLLVLGLVLVGYAETSDNANVSFGTSSGMSLKILNGDTVSLPSGLDPTTSHTFTDETKLKVKSNVSWTLASDITAGTDWPEDVTVDDVISVTVNPSSGSSGTHSNIDASYTLSNLEELPPGSYEATVTFNVSAQG